MEDTLIALFNKLELFIGAIIALGGKFAYDRQKNGRKPVSITDTDVTLDSPIGHKDSVMIWLTDRIHKMKDEVNIPVTKNSAAIEELRIKVSYIQEEAKESKLENAMRIARLHEHIDNRSDKLEVLIEKLRDKRNEH